MEYLDRLLTCSDCGSEFVFTAGEQLFFFEKQFKNDPKRCKPCKNKRTGTGVAVRAGAAATPAGSLRTETRTECSACHVETTVPFKPTQGRPVLCRQCFQARQVPGLASAKNRDRVRANVRMNSATAELVAAASSAEHSVCGSDRGSLPARV